MSGHYSKSPLTYVVAQVKTTPLPSLTKDQWALIEQMMIKCGLPEPVVGEVREYSINLGEDEQSSTAPAIKKLPRAGFFSPDRTSALILGQNGIEWRTTQYSRFSDVIEKFSKAIKAISQTVDSFEYMPVKELTLSYVDLIAPLSGRDLADYFNSRNKVLPLEMINVESTDIETFGSVQVNRIVETDKRIFISMDQLPVKNGKPVQLLPQDMMEPDEKFGMPVQTKDWWDDLQSEHYILLTTQAALLVTDGINLGNLDLKETINPIHELTRSTFKSLINHDVCNVDWKYREDEKDESL
jgi:uncharacterized protein (TIGR04255 family)